MNNTDRIQQCFQENIALQQKTLDLLAPAIDSAAQMLTQALCRGAKILCCGNGGSASQAQHFTSELLNRFERERPGLPAIPLTCDSATLTSIANDTHFQEVFARQIQALGNQGDILVLFTTSGISPNILQAARIAQERGLAVIAVSGKDGGELTQILGEKDLELRVPSQETPRIQEIHLLIAHCLCDLVDRNLFGN
ncbi:MAG: phosphoheptose isomerase [Methylothermaceae bacteria B42]|nr:MAG: phosphoheptose isomerase [Methylothermaceae bacteria B42]HHJ39620.1 SIS domain-containing protein [Methylothermaceae bacterium]